MAALLETAPDSQTTGADESELQRDVNRLADNLSKLNPSAKEFVPSIYAAADCTGEKKPADDGARPSLSVNSPVFVASGESYYYGGYMIGHGFTSGSNRDSNSVGSTTSSHNRKKRNVHNFGRRRSKEKSKNLDREDSIKRTVYVSDINSTVTEERLAEEFSQYGQVVDCRICGDPRSKLRFAFIEFSDEDSSRNALKLTGTMLDDHPVRVLPSKTAILPVNPKFLPKTDDEKEMVIRTVYCTNIDKKVTQTDVKFFFEQSCGKVSRLRLLGDNMHSTGIAFVEFVLAESAIAALNCCGVTLGNLPIRVSPSKTPVRSRSPRPPLDN